MKKWATTLLLLSLELSPAAAGDVVLPPITEDTLTNGLVVMVVENHELPVVDMRLVVKAGSVRDPKGKAGLASFTAGMLRKGTETRTATQIAEAIDFVGGSLSTSADRDAAYIRVDVLLKHFDVGLDVLADIVLNPVFDSTEIERFRQQVISGIIQSRDDANQLCARGFAHLLFADHPYGMPVVGTQQTVSAITREDIVGFHNDFFRPGNSFLVVAGDVKPDVVLAKVAIALEEWQEAPVPALQVPAVPPPKGYRILLVNKPDATQTNIRFGHLGITRQNPDYYSLILMNYILGRSFVSRLTRTVRVEGGLTYDIRTVNEWNMLPAAYYCNTFTNNDSTMSAIRKSLEVIRGMREAEVTDEEYRDAVNFYAGFYPMTLETPSEVAAEIVKIKLYGLPVSYIEDFVDNIKKVTKADILRVARKYIDPDDMVFCVVSNAAEVKDSLETLGPVEVKSVDEM